MPQFGGASEKCNVCDKTVYLAEKIVVEDKEAKKTFHKTCLKCTHCKATLSLGNYASMNGIMYCKPHFKQLFASKGNYDEGFGKEKLTSKWSPAPTAVTSTAGSFVPVDKQDDARPAEKKETPSSVASRFQKSSLTSEKCEKCNKSVYATEKIVIEEKEGKRVFHKSCLRCTHCQVILTLGNYASMNGTTYCKPHLKQLFATKGNYDEGFGKEKHTTKWEAHQTSSPPASFVPVEKTDTQQPNKVSSPADVSSRFKTGSDKCTACGKTVYLTERVVVEDKENKSVFHKACLRCSHCQVVLSLGNYASMNSVMYCKPHFKQLFATKGNYDEGFGKEKHSAKWVEQDEKSQEGETKPHRDEEEAPRHVEHHSEDPVQTHTEEQPPEHHGSHEHEHEHEHKEHHEDAHEHNHHEHPEDPVQTHTEDPLEHHGSHEHEHEHHEHEHHDHEREHDHDEQHDHDHDHDHNEHEH